MSVGLLIVTHNRIGTELLETVRTTLGGSLPLTAAAIEVTTDIKLDTLKKRIATLVPRLDSGDGLLILCDAFGATPCNQARSLVEVHGAYLVSGVNLTMLLKVCNYHTLPLAELATKAAEGARQGITIHAPD
ncbi:MAG: PTS sugar transporter subunit IIA [Gammaproteobacteria bacterium]